jgi:hypothetical protein
MRCHHRTDKGVSTVAIHEGRGVCLRCHSRGYRSIWRILHIDRFDGFPGLR